MTYTPGSLPDDRLGCRRREMTQDTSPDLTGRSLLAVFAHPDDESIAAGGLLALCADLGAQVSLLCLTHGELDRGEASSRTGQTRVAELRAAAAVLGLAAPIILEYADGMLPWTDPAILETDIRDTVERVRPEVVVTFGEDGLYWHPDHIAVHERTTAVVAGMRDAPAIYYVTMPPGQMRHLVDHVMGDPTRRGDGNLRRDILGVEDADAFGSMAAPPTLVLALGARARRKLAAIRCHASQVQDSPLGLLREQEAEQFLGTEHYRRSEVGFQGDSFIEQLGSKARHSR